jgi:hypothetical protein
MTVPELPQGEWIKRAKKAEAMIIEAEQMGFKLQQAHGHDYIDALIVYASNMLNITQRMQSPQPPDVDEVAKLISNGYNRNNVTLTEIDDATYDRLTEAQKALYYLTIVLRDISLKNHNDHCLKLTVKLKKIAKKENLNVAI